MNTVLEHHTAHVKDIRVHYVRAGIGEPVVLLHGWPQTWAAWKRVIPLLAQRFTVIVPDLRGLGGSSKADQGYDTDNVADDIHVLVRQLGFHRIFLAGHDWGAAAGYAYAAQFPDEIRRLSIFEMLLPGLGMIEGAMAPRANGTFLWHMGFQSVPDIPIALIQGREEIYLRWFFEHFAYDPYAVSGADTDEYVRAITAVGGLRASLGYYRSLFESAAQNERHRKRKLEIPVSAWGGDVSLGSLTKQCLEMVADNVIGGVIDRCGHWVGEERPNFVATHLLEFFGAE